jgi:hypothetical protein
MTRLDHWKVSKGGSGQNKASPYRETLLQILAADSG